MLRVLDIDYDNYYMDMMIILILDKYSTELYRYL